LLERGIVSNSGFDSRIALLIACMVFGSANARKRPAPMLSSQFLRPSFEFLQEIGYSGQKRLVQRHDVTVLGADRQCPKPWMKDRLASSPPAAAQLVM
jgi:hypothetical protein